MDLDRSFSSPTSPPIYKEKSNPKWCRVVLELSGLKGVLFARIMEDNTNRMTFKVSITNSTSNGVVSLQMIKGSVLNEEMRRKAQGSSSQSEKHCFLWKNENKGKKGKSKEKDDDRVTAATSDDLVILQDFESVNFVSDESDFGVLKMGNDGVTKISVHMLDDGGYDNHFVHGKWKLIKGNLVVVRGEKFSKLYWTKALVAKDNVNAMDMEASLWHRRLSHISEKRLNCLAKKDVLPGLKNAELEKCSHCMAGKHTRVSFQKHPPSRKSELLELEHSDICGPLKVKSFSGALYFVTFIDDCSRKLWVYVLKTKDQMLEKFKQFQALVKRQSNKKVKCIRLDNAERMNKTLIERVRCVLSEARLPKHLWGDALYSAVHVINLNPAVALNTEVPDKILFGEDVKYDYL
ncbi:hypothetical protein CR513_29156, partial [Mucuna pruriens]